MPPRPQATTRALALYGRGVTTYGRELLGHLLEQLPAGPSPVTHTVDLPAREAGYADWPSWAHPGLVEELRGRGVARPWAHQVATAEHAHAGRHVVVATGTASGKSLGYQLPALSTLAADRGACVLRSEEHTSELQSH